MTSNLKPSQYDAPPLAPDPEAAWRAAVEIDLQAAIALGRASASAMLALSPLAHREMREALDHEVASLSRWGDPIAEAAADIVRQCIPGYGR